MSKINIDVQCSTTDQIFLTIMFNMEASNLKQLEMPK